MKPADFRDFVYGIARSGFSTRTAYFRRRSPDLTAGKTNLQIRRWKNLSNSLRLTSLPGLAKSILMPLCPALTTRRRCTQWLSLNAPPCFAGSGNDGDRRTKRHLTYVIGTEVPVPGGEASAINAVHVTREQDAARTLQTHQAAFRAPGWRRH